MLKCKTSYNECNCHCHDNPHIHHIVACCVQCPVCCVNIKYGFNEHYEECKQNQVLIEKKVQPNVPKIEKKVNNLN